MKRKQPGFTLLELLTVVAILAILATLAVVGYRAYMERARAPDIIEKYDALRVSVGAQAQAGKTDDCAQFAQNLGKANLDSAYATLAYGFEATPGGYRPVLNVCALADPAKPLRIPVARAAHDTMLKTGMVEKNAVLTESVVSYALRLSDGDEALCKSAPPAVASACGTPPATTTGTGTGPGTAPGPGTTAVSGGSTASGGTAGGSSAQPPASTSTTTPPQPPVNHHEQCVAQCRQTICLNCNSRAYRNCVANCPH